MAFNFATADFTRVDRGKDRIEEEVARLRRRVALVGFPSNAAAPEDEDGNPLPMTMASLALIHEKGSPANNIPARPLMKQTRERVQKHFAALLRGIIKRVYAGKVTTDKALARLGAKYEGEMKDSFVVETFTPNRPATIRRKGSSRPLIDTGAMRQSIRHKVAGLSEGKL